MEYKYIVLTLLWFAFMLPEKAPAQPGCGQFYLEYPAAENENFSSVQVKSFYKLANSKRSRKVVVYPQKKANNFFYLAHMDGQQTIVFKTKGAKMKMTIDHLNCESNYLIDQLRFEPGHFKFDLRDKQLSHTKDDEKQNETCANCLRIPFTEFTKEL